MKLFGMGSVAAVAATLSTLALLACTTEATSEADAPAVADDTLGEDYIGASWDGWYQSTAGTYNVANETIAFNSFFSRTSGPATRGGGACYTVKLTGTSCSTDSGCSGAATAAFAGGYGYCYQNVCYARPGSQGAWCTLAGQRPPGNLSKTVSGLPFGWTEGTHFVLGCMTTNAGNPSGPSTCSQDQATNLNTRIMSAVSYVSSCFTGCAEATYLNFRCDYCHDTNCDGVQDGCEGPDGAFIPPPDWGVY